MKFFFDRNVPLRSVKILQIYDTPAGHALVHLNEDSRFHQKSTDVDIIRTLHDEDPEWVLVGGDGRILKNEAEVAVLADCNLTYLLFKDSWCQRPITDTCWMMIKGWPAVVAEVERLKCHSVLEWKYGGDGRIENRGPTARFRPRPRKS